MSDLALVLTTTDSERLSLRIASALVEQRLAACVNIIKSVRSIYRWKDKIHDDEEFVLLVKTLREALPEVRRTIKEMHTYDLPDIVELSIGEADPPVAEWIAGCVRRPESASS